MCVLREEDATAQRRPFPLGRWVSLAPSLSDLAFLMPMLVLFWCATGVAWLLTDSDTGWHIRTGEWILKNRRVPATDLFSFTTLGQPWFAWEWLSDVSMAAIHSHFGLSGIVLVSLLVLGATSVCIYSSTVEESEHRLIAILLTGLAMAASTIHWLARPHLVTPLFAAAFCWVLNRVEKRASDDRLLLQLPALMVVWVNLHGGFFVGIALLMTYALGTAVEELVYGSWDQCLAWGEEVSTERHCMRCREPRQSLRISPAHPRAAISRVLFLFQAHQRIPIRRLSHVYGLLFRNSARARDRRGGLAFGQGEAHSGPAAAELVTLGTVLGSQHSHLCCCFIPRNWSGNARLVETGRHTLATRLARTTSRECG
jgi:hypothetical protein